MEHSPEMALMAQINLNHSGCAQDLMYQTAREMGISLIAIAEPHSVPTTSQWTSDLDGRSAIYIPGEIPSRRVLCRGHGYVAVEWANMAVMAVYLSPALTIVQFEDVIDTITIDIGNTQKEQWVIMGDFNAKSCAWDSQRTWPKGRYLENWAAELDIRVMNEIGITTCRRTQSESVVDLTFITPNMVRQICEWKVREDRYADDTLVVVGAESGEEACRLAEVAIQRLKLTMTGIGLRIAAEKTEAILFAPSRHRRTEGLTVLVDNKVPWC